MLRAWDSTSEEQHSAVRKWLVQHCIGKAAEWVPLRVHCFLAAHSTGPPPARCAVRRPTCGTT